MSSILNTLLAIMLVLTACGCFLVGINLMSKGFVQATINRQDGFLTRGFRARNRFAGVGSGLLYTILSQSSDVTSVTLVRLADLGIITLMQACACIIGANIGTTVTTFIVSLSAYNLTPFFAFFAFIGAIPLLSKKRKLKIFGQIVAGFGVLFIGLQLLQANIENDAFRSLVNTLFNSTVNPLILVGIAVSMTMIVQSSSVVTSMVVFLISGTLLPLESALCLVVGANIGTCITALISTIGTSINARRTGIIHLLFNCFGTVIFTIIIWIFRDQIMNILGKITNKPAMQIAWFHVFF